MAQAETSQPGRQACTRDATELHDNNRDGQSVTEQAMDKQRKRGASLQMDLGAGISPLSTEL